VSVVAGSLEDQVPFAKRRLPAGKVNGAGKPNGSPTTKGGAASAARVDTLVVGNHLRAGGLDEGHVAAFCELEGRWPPLLIWARQPEVVLDGAHRLAAARRLGHDTVQVLAFEGNADQAFVEAVRRNIGHGLPLSVADRTRAGEHMLRRHPDWSNRRIAEVCGLSPHTVAKLREAPPQTGKKSVPITAASTVPAAAPVPARQSKAVVRSAGPEPVPDRDQPRGDDRIVDIESRWGRDGKARPAQPGLLRERVVEAIRANPGGSLRQIASVAKVSPETVRRIRKEVDQPEGPDISILAALRAPAESDTDWHDDPALRSNPHLVSWLDHTDPAGDLESFALGVPLSRVYELADEARRRAGRWAAFAEVLESRVRSRGYSLL
jgi:ParB-like chromosome segregation protein Spo0J